MRQFKTISTVTTELEKFQNNCVVTFGEVEADIKSLRIAKPSYKYASESAIIISGSSFKPIVIKIGNVLFSVEGNLSCDLNTVGVGGLTNALQINTAYYLYAVARNQQVKLVASPIDPDNGGPSGLGEWSYIGAFATDGSSVIQPFQSSNGVIIFEEPPESETHTGNTTSTAKTFSSLPVTAKQGYFTIALTPSAANQSGRVTSVSSTSNVGLSLTGQVASQLQRGFGWVIVLTAKTLYLRVSNAAASVTAGLMGWAEDPSGYK